jgi:uncharacterized phage-associated protein
MKGNAQGRACEPSFNEAKFRELLLYIAARCEGHAHYGATKLNKALFMADFFTYYRTGQAITGARYTAGTYGPVPEPMERVQRDMIKSKEIGIKRNGREQRVVALREPELRDFTGQEIALVDYVIDNYRSHTARDLSNLTHGFPGWLAAWRESQATGKVVVIPYQSILIEAPELDPFEEARILKMAEQRGWLAKRPVGTQP